MRYLTALLSSLILSASAAWAADVFPPAGNHHAAILTVGVPKEAEEIAQRMQRALAANRAWLKAYLREKNLKPGEILPYHENFGITEEEYALFLETGRKMTLNKIGDIKARIKKTDDKTTIVLTGIGLPVDTFEFTADGKTMKCELGTTSERTEIDQTDAASPTGKWRGHQWELRQGDPDITGKADFLNLKFAVGTDATDRNLFYIRLNGRRDGNGKDVIVVVRWPEGE